MLFGKTVYSSYVCQSLFLAEMYCVCVCGVLFFFSRAICIFAFVLLHSMCVLQQGLYTIAQGQPRSPAHHLPSLSSSASQMSPQPVCFSNWPLLMEPSAVLRPIQNCRSQMFRVILKPHKNSADITVQIAGNYDFSSRGKYAQISSYNWSLLKIKAVWEFKSFCLFYFQ